MTPWTITNSSGLFEDYDMNGRGIGNLVGHSVNIKAHRRISIDVWGHSESREATEEIANTIINSSSLLEENTRLKEQNAKLVEALKDVIHHHIEFGGLHTDTQNKVVNTLKEIES